MTLLFMDGLDSANLLPKPEWDTAFAFNPTTGRRGDANGAATIANSGQLKVLTLPSAAATCIIGFAIFLPSSSDAFGHSGAALARFKIGATAHLVLNINSAGKLTLRLSSSTGTLLATSTGPTIALNTWVHIQAKATIHNTAGSCEVRQNGVTVINYTGQTGTAAGAVTAVDIVMATSNTITWDDMWVCDAVDATATQGRAFNDFLGDLKVVSLIPTADTATAQWTPSTGTSHAGTVDEVPPNTTDYVSTPTVGNRDLFDVTDLPANTTGVLAYRVGMYAQKSDVGAMSVKPVVKDPAGTAAQTAVALSTSWASGYGPMTTKKTDGSLSTVADMNATQVGIEAA